VADVYVFGITKNMCMQWLQQVPASGNQYGGAAGDDKINSGPGEDIVIGGFGSDTIHAGDVCVRQCLDTGPAERSRIHMWRHNG
jgi:hypothetical protein